METEPDYRFTLANERTFLAWQRTALGLLAAAVAVVQFMPETVPNLRTALGAAIGLLALLVSAAGLHRWYHVDHAMRRGRPLPRPATPLYVTVGLLSIGAVTVALSVAATVGGL